MRSSFLYSMGIGIASGIFFRSFFDIGYVMFGVTVVIAITLYLASRLLKQSGIEIKFLTLSTLFVISFGVGIFRLHIAEDITPLYSAYVGEEVRLTGTVVLDPEDRGAFTQLIVQSGDVDERILVKVDSASVSNTGISYGDSIIVQGVLEQPVSFVGEAGREFQYDGYLRSKNIWYTISYAEVELAQEGERSLIGSLYAFKHAFMGSIEKVLPEPHAGLGEGILLGVKRALGGKLETVFQTTGITHIVVLSGYNMLIVAECVIWLLAFFFRPRTRMVSAIVIVILFALLVGLSASVVRATIMTSLLLIARGIGREYAVVRALMLAGVCMLIHNPYLLVYDPGFQLSFLATLGLVAITPVIESWMQNVPDFYGLKRVFTATLGAQIAVLPLILYHMGTLSVVSIVVNVLVLPAVPVAMLLTFVGGVVGFISNTLGTLVSFPAYLTLGYIIGTAQLFAEIPYAATILPPFSFWYVVIAYACIGIVLVRMSACNFENEIVTEDGSISDAHDDTYADWTIEEENKNAPTLPFR